MLATLTLSPWWVGLVLALLGLGAGLLALFRVLRAGAREDRADGGTAEQMPDQLTPEREEELVRWVGKLNGDFNSTD